jgi:hypothetical protein
MPTHGAAYDLSDVAACLATGHVVVSTGTAVEMIGAVLGMERPAAVRFATEIVGRLHPGNYSRTVLLRQGPADEYGLVVHGTSWYVKLHLNRAAKRLHIVSCHLPEREIHTVEGIVTCTHHGIRPYA